MEDTYVLENLNQLIRAALNPNVNWDIPGQNMQELYDKIELERTRVENELTRQVFNTKKARNIQELIQKNHNFLVPLLDKVYQQSFVLRSKFPRFDKLYPFIIHQLESLIGFFELHFSAYICMEMKVPEKYFKSKRIAMEKQLDGFEADFVARIGDASLTDIVLGAIRSFLEADYPIGHAVTFCDIRYYQDLITELQHLSEPEREGCIFSALNEFLIRFDFNSTKYINHFTSRERAILDAIPEIGEQQKYLLLRRKEFLAMHTRTDKRLNNSYPGLKESIGKWFDHELEFLEMKLSSLLFLGKQIPDQQIRMVEQPEPVKVMCNLSGDQISILIRALIDEEMISGQSVSAIYRAIVPHLSTKEKKDLSWNTMRGNRMEVESRDQAIALEWIERLKKRVTTY